MMLDWDAMLWDSATSFKVVFRGSQILWIRPHQLGDGWINGGKTEPRACYAHQGD